jgi:predicted acyltransferase
MGADTDRRRMMTYKPGYRTTEFAVTVLTAVGALAAALAGQLSPRWAAIAAAVSVAAYAISRGLAKLAAPPNVPTQTPQ